jgi:transglutaminase-like putative cysteine protease
VELLRRGGPVPALLPGLAVLAVAQAYAPAAGAPAVSLAAGWTALALLTLARVGITRLLAGAVALAVVGVPAAWAAVGFSAAGRTATTLDGTGGSLPVRAPNPLDELAGRLATGDRVAFEVHTTAPVDRWTLVVLDAFDGAAWTSTGGYQRLGGALPADPAVTVPTRAASARIAVRDLPGRWLPSRSRTTAVSGTGVRVDPATGVLLGDTVNPAYTLHWRAPDLSAADLPAAAVDPVLGGPMRLGVVPAALPEFAREAVGGDPPSVRTALRLESFLRDNYRVATGDRPPTGHSYAQLSYFLGTSRRGTSEQFATAYVVLARLVGIPARLAVGFRQPAAGTVVRNRDMLVWPEIAVAGYGWIPLDPTSSVAGAEGRPSLPDPSDARPPPSPAPALTAPAPSGPPTTPAGAGASPPPQPSIAVPVLAAVTGVALALLVTIPLVKGVRRARRRRGTPEQVVAGAWAEAGDRLRDHGRRVDAAMTPRDVARAAGPEVSTALIRLAACVDAVRWSEAPAPDPAGDEAWRAVDAVRDGLRGDRWRLRLRALFAPGTLLPRRAGQR